MSLFDRIKGLFAKEPEPPESSYLYPGTRTLVNLPGIKDAELLDKFERLSTRQRIEEGVPPFDLTPAGYRSIHRHLFGDVYSWAGQYRESDIGKRDPTGQYRTIFMSHELIAGDMNRIFTELKGENFLKPQPYQPHTETPDYFAQRAGEYIREINNVHPFREGNGRTMRVFLAALAEQAGHQLDMTRIEPRLWNEASVEASNKISGQPLARIIRAAIVERERVPEACSRSAGDEQIPNRSEYQPGSHKPALKEPGRDRDDRGGRGD